MLTDIQGCCLTVLRIEGPVTTRELASLTGIPRSMVSTTVRELARMGLAAGALNDPGEPIWDVTQAGRKVFAQLHRHLGRKAREARLEAKLKARAEWKPVTF